MTAGVITLPFSSRTAGVSSLRTAVTVPPPEALIVGVPTLTVASVAPTAAVTVILGGHMIVGGLVSRTVTVKVQLAAPNSDVEAIECVPTGKNDPEGGLLETAPQLPVTAAAAKVTNAPNSPSKVVFAVTTTLAGQSRVHVSAPAPEIVRLLEDESFKFLGSGTSLETLAVLEIIVPAWTPEGTS